MLFFPFKNYEEFKCLFGIVEHGNGEKSRKNKILLALYKDRDALRDHIAVRDFKSLYDGYCHCDRRCDRAYDKSDERAYRKLRAVRRRFADKYEKMYDVYGERQDLIVRDLPTLRNVLYNALSRKTDKAYHVLDLNGRRFYSSAYTTDDMGGLCEDGTVNAIRYVNVEKHRVFKMKAGRLFNHILEDNDVTRRLPEQIKRWLSEVFVGEWIQYASEQLCGDRYELHVDDNFSDIYDSDCCIDNFGSCMVDDGQWTFYRDAVDAKAAYLTDRRDDDQRIVARCIVFTDVTDEDGKRWRLAERQYSSDSDLALQRQLVTALIRGGHIDGYKKVGASCHDSRAFVSNEGESLADKRFSIRCTLDYGDTLSYQDSFKNYDIDEHVATNYGSGEIALDITDSSLEDPHDHDAWSSYHGEYIDEEQAAWVESRDDYFYESETVYATVIYGGRRHEERCYEGDCVCIGGDYYYAGRDCDDQSEYGIGYCEECEEYFLAEDAVYSEITEEYYCCAYCRDRAEQAYKENHWFYSEYDGEYFEDDDEVVRALMWNERLSAYESTTIHTDTLDGLIDDGCATEIDGNAYIDEVGFDGEPVHFAAEVCVA